MLNLFKKRNKSRLTEDEYFLKQERKGYDENGQFVPDPTPMAPPVGYRKQPSMVEIVREMVRSERLRAEAEASGHESFEDADDFDVDDEPEQLKSGWENDFDPPIKEMAQEGAKSLSAKEKAKKEKEQVRGAGDKSPADSQSSSEAKPTAEKPL